MNDTSSFSERMRAQARGTWNAILGHRFFREVATDAIDDQRLRPILEDRIRLRRHCGADAGLRHRQGAFVSGAAAAGPGPSWAVTDQEQFFIHAFARMGVRAEERTGLPPQGLCASSARALPRRRRDGGLRGDPRLRLGGGVDVSDLVLDGQPVAVVKGLYSGLGGASRRRRVCRPCRVGPLGNRCPRTGARQLPAGAPECAVRKGFGGGNRFPRRRLRCLRQTGSGPTGGARAGRELNEKTRG